MRTLNVSWLYGLVDQMTPSLQWAPVAWLPNGSWSDPHIYQCLATNQDWSLKRRTVICHRVHSQAAVIPGGLCSASPFWMCQSSVLQPCLPQVFQVHWIHWIREQRFLDQPQASCCRLYSKLATSQITEDRSWNSTSKSCLQLPKRRLVHHYISFPTPRYKRCN